MTDEEGETALIKLFWSNHLTKINFNAEWFKYLFYKEKNIFGNAGWTPLMSICNRNSQILNNNLWFIPKLLEQIGKKVEDGRTALDIYFYSTKDTSNSGFNKLSEAYINQI